MYIRAAAIGHPLPPELREEDLIAAMKIPEGCLVQSGTTYSGMSTSPALAHLVKTVDVVDDFIIVGNGPEGDVK